jgi:hypothetical protein
VEVTPQQLRDDLLSMLVAGHETTASVLTWTLKLLVDSPACLAKAQAEADASLSHTGGSVTSMAQAGSLGYLMRCLNESMRLYPHPPVLIRRASEPDVLPGGYPVPAGQDIIISVYNIHRSPAVWEAPDEFRPERFPLDEPVPNESNTDYRYIPFSGGPRKCVGDQFALLEAVTGASEPCADGSAVRLTRLLRSARDGAAPLRLQPAGGADHRADHGRHDTHHKRTVHARSRESARAACRAGGCLSLGDGDASRPSLIDLLALTDGRSRGATVSHTFVCVALLCRHAP